MKQDVYGNTLVNRDQCDLSIIAMTFTLPFPTNEFFATFITSYNQCPMQRIRKMVRVYDGWITLSPSYTNESRSRKLAPGSHVFILDANENLRRASHANFLYCRGVPYTNKHLAKPYTSTQGLVGCTLLLYSHA